jgi:hypothetical protein
MARFRAIHPATTTINHTMQLGRPARSVSPLVNFWNGAFLVLGVQLRDGLNSFFDVSWEDCGSVGVAHVSS